MFKIKSVSAKYMTIKSIKTGMYLASNEDGKAFMKEVKTTQDRQTWFHLHLIPDLSCNFDYTSNNYTVTYQSPQVEAC